MQCNSTAATYSSTVQGMAVCRTHLVRSGDLVPARWSPPEAMCHEPEFGFPADVWSFGVFCWELATVGQTPYANKSAIEVRAYVVELGKNPGCPPGNKGTGLYENIMLPCWNYLQSVSGQQTIPQVFSHIFINYLFSETRQKFSPV